MEYMTPVRIVVRDLYKWWIHAHIEAFSSANALATLQIAEEAVRSTPEFQNCNSPFVKTFGPAQNSSTQFVKTFGPTKNSSTQSVKTFGPTIKKNPEKC